MEVIGVVTWSAGIFALGLVFKAVVDYFEEKKAEGEFIKILKTLPAEFLHYKSAETLIIGPTGIWLLKFCRQTEYSGRSGEKLLKEMQAQSAATKKLIRGKTALDLKVQPVLVLPDSKADIKFEFLVNLGVDIIRRKWVTKLLTEYPAENLDIQTLEKLKIPV